MNHKLIKASLAGLAAVAVTAGGGTFASWTDTTSTIAKVGAGQLTISLDDNATGSTVYNVNDRLSLAPGEGAVRDIYIASVDAESVPDANMFVTVTDLGDYEDGCTSASEAPSQALLYPGSDCSNTTQPGQFSKWVDVMASSSPAPAGGDCSGGSYDNLTLPGSKKLDDLAGEKTAVKNGGSNLVVEPGDGICVRLDFTLPVGAPNAVQGDASDFKLVFDLEQIV